MAHAEKSTLDTLIFLWQLYGYVSPIKNMEATCTFSHLCYIHGPPILQFVARKCTEFVLQYCMTL